MNQMKKYLVVMTAMAVIASLSACGNNETSEKESNSNKTESVIDEQNAESSADDKKETSETLVSTAELDDENTDSELHGISMTLLEDINNEVDTYAKLNRPRMNFADDNYIYSTFINNVYMANINTKLTHYGRTGFWYNDKLYSVMHKKKSDEEFESGLYLNCHTYDGQLLGRLLIAPFTSSYTVKNVWADKNENLLIHLSANKEIYLYVNADMSNFQTVEFSGGKDEENYNILGFYNDKICYMDEDAIYLMDTNSFKSEIFSNVNDGLAREKPALIGKYLFLSRHIIDLEKQEVVLKITDDMISTYGYTDYYYKSVAAWASSVCNTSRFNYVYTLNDGTLYSCPRNKDFILGYDFTDETLANSGKIVYENVEAYASVSDEWVFIMTKEYDKMFFNTVSGQEIPIPDETEYFDKSYPDTNI